MRKKGESEKKERQRERERERESKALFHHHLYWVKFLWSLLETSDQNGPKWRPYQSPTQWCHPMNYIGEGRRKPQRGIAQTGRIVDRLGDNKHLPIRFAPSFKAKIADLDLNYSSLSVLSLPDLAKRWRWGSRISLTGGAGEAAVLRKWL